jgi:hypothetical protein
MYLEVVNFFYIFSISRFLPKEDLRTFLEDLLKELCPSDLGTENTMVESQESYRLNWYNSSWLIGKCLQVSAAVKLELGTELQSRVIEHCLKNLYWNGWVLESLRIFTKSQMR